MENKQKEQKKPEPKPDPFKHLAWLIKYLECYQEPIEKIAEKK